MQFRGLIVLIGSDNISIFVTSDQHFGHKNIIEYSDRPFDNVEHMNEELVKNWNNEVSQNDTVIFLGDLTCSRSQKTDDWLQKLNGNIFFIRGNHDYDKSNIVSFVNRAIIEIEGIELYFIHNPAKLPEHWDGWSIHGHIHNHIDEPPRTFIDYDTKRVNVNVELTNYSPINISEIIKLIRKAI